MASARLIRSYSNSTERSLTYASVAAMELPLFLTTAEQPASQQPVRSLLNALSNFTQRGPWEMH